MSRVLKSEAAILFTGRSGAGKTEAADYLTLRVPLARKYPAATLLKLIAETMGWDGEKDTRGRALLQHLGDVGRDYNPDMWIDAAIQACRDDLSRGFWTSVFVADDIRYLNEIERVSEVYPKTYVVKVVRPGGGCELGGTEGAHRSEQFWDTLPFNYKIVNDGSLVDLFDAVDTIIGTIGWCPVAQIFG